MDCRPMCQLRVSRGGGLSFASLPFVRGGPVDSRTVAVELAIPVSTIEESPDSRDTLPGNAWARFYRAVVQLPQRRIRDG